MGVWLGTHVEIDCLNEDVRFDSAKSDMLFN